MHMVMESAALGRKIRECRIVAGLTQEGLAEKLGVTFQQVQKYERGATKVNLARLQQLAEVLDVPISAFFDESSFSACRLSEDEAKLLKAFKQLSEPLRHSVLDVISNLLQKK
jgi:transcriptional regulator with XRE-family HTH domain